MKVGTKVRVKSNSIFTGRIGIIKRIYTGAVTKKSLANVEFQDNKLQKKMHIYLSQLEIIDRVKVKLKPCVVWK